MTHLGLPLQTISDDEIPFNVLGYISVRGPDSVFGAKARTLNKSSGAYHASKADRDSVRRDLEKNGFKILAESPLGMSVCAPGAAYEDLTGGELRPIERLTQGEAGRVRYVTHFDIVGKKQPAALGVGAVKSKA